MILPWFAPLGIAIGAVGTQTALKARHALKAKSKRSWWLLLLLSWFPTLCWIMAQFIVQD